MRRAIGFGLVVAAPVMFACMQGLEHLLQERDDARQVAHAYQHYAAHLERLLLDAEPGIVFADWPAQKEKARKGPSSD